MEHEAYLEMAASEDRHWWFRGRRQILEAVIAGLGLPPDAKILELGSGTGGNFAMLSRFGVVTAVELNEVARNISLGKTPSVQDVRAGSLPGDLPLGDQKFDLICLFDVLEHVEDDVGTLAVIRTHLAQGGRAVITVPAFARLWGPHDVALHHKRRYEKAELTAKINAAGLGITKMTYANMGLFPAAVLMRLADRLLGRRKSGGDAVPPAILNEIFAAIFGAERHLIDHVTLPFGLSLLAVTKNVPPIKMKETP